MAQVVTEENKTYPSEPCDKNLLLSSLKRFQKQGVVLGVEKILTPKVKDYGDGPKAVMRFIFTILGSMPKCSLYELDENGQKIEYEDEMTGEKRFKIYIDDGQLKTVIFPFYADIKKGQDGFDEETVLIVKPKTSSYSFFREALIDSGDLPSNMGEQAFETCYGELKEALDGWEFLGKHDVTGKRKFQYLKCERVTEE